MEKSGPKISATYSYNYQKSEKMAQWTNIRPIWSPFLCMYFIRLKLAASISHIVVCFKDSEVLTEVGWTV
jgi:hypothetical protein